MFGRSKSNVDTRTNDAALFTVEESSAVGEPTPALYAQMPLPEEIEVFEGMVAAIHHQQSPTLPPLAPRDPDLPLDGWEFWTIFCHTHHIADPYRAPYRAWRALLNAAWTGVHIDRHGVLSTNADNPWNPTRVRRWTEALISLGRHRGAVIAVAADVEQWQADLDHYERAYRLRHHDE